jgi:translocation and assembly module TamB
MAAGLVLLLLALPLWFPWLLRPLARGEGARYAAYERLGYGRFALHDVTFTNRTLRFQAARLEAYVPSAWLWQLGRKHHAGPFVGVKDWELQFLPTTRSTATSSTEEIQSVAATVHAVQRWCPQGMLANGTLRFGSETLAAPSLTWSNGQVSARVYSPRLEAEATVDGTLNRWPATVQLKSESLHAEAELALTTNLTGLDLKATGGWWSNRLELQAHFGPSGSLPETVRLMVPDFQMRGAQLGLPVLEQLGGTCSANWTTGRFELALDGKAQPVVAQTQIAPVTVAVRAHGDSNAVTVETATLSSTWLEARLSAELSLYFTGRLLRQPAVFEVLTRLDALPESEFHGALRGQAELQVSSGKIPTAQFQLSGSQVGYSSVTADKLDLEGDFAWPWLKITRAEAGLVDGSTASLFGEMNLESNTVASARVEVRGPFGRQWLPEGCSYDGLRLTATLAGPLSALQHRGDLSVTNLIAPRFQPLQLQADWKGQQEKLEQIGLLATAQGSSLEAGGALSIGPSEIQVALARFALQTNGRPILSLTQPCEIRAGRPQGDRTLSLRTTAIALAGPAGEAEVETALSWPQQGKLRASLKHLSSAPLATLLRTNLPETEIRQLDASAEWSNGPVRVALELSIDENLRQITAPSPEAAQLFPDSLSSRVKLTADENGLVVSNLTISTPTSTVAVVRGFLPLTFTPGGSNGLVQPILQRACDLSATARPHAFFWRQLARWTGVEVLQPNLQATVSGTWDDPLGQIALQAQSLHFLAGPTNLPVLENLICKVEINPQQARLTEGTLLVQGQRVELTGELPLDRESWTALFKKQPPDWTRASARLKIPAADFAAFEPLVPNILAPQGTLSADVSVSAGGELSGELEVEGARTHPLGNFGSVRDIDVHLRFDERALKLESATASLSSAPLLLTGEVDLRGTQWLHGAIPPFHFTIRGNNVPLAREPEFIVRSDLDLVVTKTNDAPALISGTARLRDSYYLSDLRLLVPGKLATATPRPPYFSIGEPAVAGWRLAVNVEGEHFLKARTTLFSGELTATLKLVGALEDPIALGDVKIDSGTVRFPFANLEVQQGLITLTSQDPYRPQLSVTAASKQFGYDIHMSVSGPADAPIIQFTSTPPLSSEQILLMVTAGQLPQGTFNLTSQQRAETLALFLGKDLLAKLGIGDEGQQRLILHSGEEISEQGRPTYHVEYKLTDRWSLVGDYDRFGDYNAGLKWRVYSK